MGGNYLLAFCLTAFFQCVARSRTGIYLEVDLSFSPAYLTFTIEQFAAPA
nr:MAG TPA: hypothetical protein [Caudoviricetes sp.]